MDKLVIELLNLLREMLVSQKRLLQIAIARQEAMRVYEIERMNSLLDLEKAEMQRAEQLQQHRQFLMQQFQRALGPGVEPKVSEIARRASEPAKSRLLCIAAELRAVVEQLDRHTRINSKVSETVIKGLAKVLKVVTGMAQHAGLYMRNGRKAALRGIHMLEITA